MKLNCKHTTCRTTWLYQSTSRVCVCHLTSSGKNRTPFSINGHLTFCVCSFFARVSLATMPTRGKLAFGRSEGKPNWFQEGPKGPRTREVFQWEAQTVGTIFW